MDFMTTLAKNFPNVIAHVSGADGKYANIVWEGGAPLPSEAELIAAHQNDHKESKIQELSDACAKDIISGFVSSALGSEHLYDSEAVDQLNIVGSYVATTPDRDNPDGTQSYHAARPIVNGVPQLKEYKLHDNYQMKRVLLDGVQFKLAKLTRFNAMRNDILVNTTRTTAEIDAINWKDGIVGVTH